MKIIDRLNEDRINISFEVFPPKTDAGFANVQRATDEIAKLDPSYISVTYGAGGTDSAQLAFYNQSARPIHILKNPDQNPGFEPMEFKEEPFIMSFSNPESIDAVISILQRAKYINFTSKNEPQKTE